MSKPRIHASIEVSSALQGDPQTFIPSHDVDFPGIGKVIMHHGSFAFVGQRDGDLGRGISLIVGGKCECGCGNPAQAFAANLSPDEARRFAESLIKHVELLESEAGAQVTSFFGKGARR